MVLVALEEMSSGLNSPIDNGVYLDLDVPFFAHVRDLMDTSNMFPRAILSATNKYVSLRVETIARNGHDIEILAICIQPLLRDFRPISYHGARLQMELVLAKAEDLANEVWL